MTAARHVGGSALVHMLLVLGVALPHLFGIQAIGLGDTRLVAQSASRVIHLFEVPEDPAEWTPSNFSSTPVEAIAMPVIATEVRAEPEVAPLTSEPAKARVNEHQKSIPHTIRPSAHSTSSQTTPLANIHRSGTASQVARPDYAHNPKPDYPVVLRERGVGGVVWLRVWVDAKGHPKEIEVAKGSGYRLFDEAALRAVQKWRFIPAYDAQQSLASWVEFAVRFVVNS